MIGCISSTVNRWLNVLRAVDIPGLQVEDEDPLRPRLVVAVDDPVQERGVILDELCGSPDFDTTLMWIVH